jgi:hypothetical protein
MIRHQHDVTVTIRADRDSLEKLDTVIRLLRFIVRKEEMMAGELDALRVQVSRNAEVDASAIVLLRGIKAALDAAIAAGDPAALTELSNSLGASTDALAQAVTENTPAAG